MKPILSVKFITTLLSIAITLGVVVYVLLQLNGDAIFTTLAETDGKWLALALVSYLLVYYVRTLRFQTLFGSEIKSFRGLWAVTCIYGMFNYLLPAKTGELSFPALIAKKFGVPISRAAAMLIVARLFDLIVIALVLPVVLFAFRERLSETVVYLSVLFSLVTYAVAIWFFVRSAKSWSNDVEDSAAPIRTLSGSAKRAWRGLMQGFALVAQRRLHWKLFAQTFALWFLICLNFYFIILALGYQVGIFQVSIIILFMVPLTLIPIQGFANIGTHELGWVAAFAVFNYPADVSLAIAVNSHIILLVFVVVIGMAGFLLNILETKK